MESITLDALAEELKIVPTLLKIDVEGYEYQVLEGSRSILATTPAVFVEVHILTLTRYGRKFEDLWTLIDPDKYDIFIPDEDFKEPQAYSAARASRRGAKYRRWQELQLSETKKTNIMPILIEDAPPMKTRAVQSDNLLAAKLKVGK